MIENFILELLKEINNFYKCYYEEAPNESRFPYLVSPSVAVTPLNAGYLCLFDIEIFNNIISTISVENIIDTLIKKLDGYNFKNGNIAYEFVRPINFYKKRFATMYGSRLSNVLLRFLPVILISLLLLILDLYSFNTLLTTSY